MSRHYTFHLPRESVALIGGGIASLVSVVWLATQGAEADQVQPPPTQMPILEIDLPPSVSAFHVHHDGIQHTLSQIRFDISPQDLPVLEARLPCRLGPVAAGEPEFARVGWNDRDWYTPENAILHRGCEYHHGILDADFLVDVTMPLRLTVYGVIALD